GGAWTVRGGEYWGCGRHRESGAAACANNRTVKAATMEERVMRALTSELLRPDAVEAYIREYHLASAKRAKELAREADRLKRAHRETSQKVDRLVEAIARGVDLDEIRDVLGRLRIERDQLKAEIDELDSLPVIALHPTAAEDYRREVASLFASLESNPNSRLETIPKLRRLIGRVDIFPAETGRGTRIEVTARMAAMIALATGAPAPAEIAIAGERVKGIEPSS
ncbi:MAG TPA: recombinase family protein, partial [Sphingomonadaceae bacterium]|nr:recombinase family protein [Sphingomonadaceae bacterium]